MSGLFGFTVPWQAFAIPITTLAKTIYDLDVNVPGELDTAPQVLRHRALHCGLPPQRSCRLCALRGRRGGEGSIVPSAWLLQKTMPIHVRDPFRASPRVPSEKLARKTKGIRDV